MDHRTEILDLRTALEVLRQTPGQLVETQVEVDPAAELSGVYRHVGAGGTVMRPTTVDGPAMLFHNVKGHPGCSVAIGVLASRARVASLFGCKKEELGHLVQACAAHPIQPVVITGPAPAQEVVHLASDPDFDLNRLIPAPTNTPLDAGPYITLGMCYATHPDTGRSDVTIHRMCIQSRDELSIFLQPGSRHIGAMAERGIRRAADGGTAAPAVPLPGGGNPSGGHPRGGTDPPAGVRHDAGRSETAGAGIPRQRRHRRLHRQRQLQNHGDDRLSLQHENRGGHCLRLQRQSAAAGRR